MNVSEFGLPFHLKIHRTSQFQFLSPATRKLSDQEQETSKSRVDAAGGESNPSQSPDIEVDNSEFFRFRVWG